MAADFLALVTVFFTLGEAASREDKSDDIVIL